MLTTVGALGRIKCSAGRIKGRIKSSAGRIKGAMNYYNKFLNHHKPKYDRNVLLDCSTSVLVGYLFSSKASMISLVLPKCNLATS